MVDILFSICIIIFIFLFCLNGALIPWIFDYWVNYDHGEKQ